MTEPESTDRIIGQGKALVRAIESLETIEATGAIEQVITQLLLQAYRRRLRAIVASARAWMSEEILSASDQIGDDRPALWMSET